MSIIRSKATLLLFTLAGCVHHSPDEAVLAPVVAQFTQEPFDQSNQPEYLIFADDLTANVFKSLGRDPRYRILPKAKPRVCPSDGAQCPHPHELLARVGTWMGRDSAIAIVDRTYYDGTRIVRTSEQILLVRPDGKWKVEKVLGYSTRFPM